MFTNLNASNYQYSDYFYNAEFEDLLSKIIRCYHLMIDDSVSLTNNENDIRDILLLNYLKNDSVRKKIGLVNYLFDREVPEDYSIFGITGRTDIKIQTLNTFINSNAYYIIECKRLDNVNKEGTTGLNAKYIENGICRFVSETYSSYYKTNAMIGFIVEEIDIESNIVFLNNLLENSFLTANTVEKIVFKNICPEFNYSYNSIHSYSTDNIMIYHLMFDFSNNVN